MNDVKSFWTRPEGKGGVLTLVGLGVAGWFILPHLAHAFALGASIVGNALAMAFGGILLAMLLYIVMNPQTRMAGFVLFKIVAYKLTNMFIKIDPISVMKGMIDKFQGELKKIGSEVSQLNGVLRDTTNYRDERQKEANAALSRVKAAQKLGDQRLMALNSREHARAEASATKTAGVINTMTWMITMLRKVQEALDFQVKDMSSEVRDQERDAKAMKIAFSAMLSAKKLLHASDERDMFNRAMEMSITERNQQLGQIEDFMHTSRDFMASFDMQSMAYSEEAFAKLQAWEKNADEVFFGIAKQPVHQLTQVSSNQYIQEPVSIRLVK